MKTRPSLWAVLVVACSLALAAALAACGSSKDRSFDGANGNAPSIVPTDAITVEPADASLDVADGQPPPTLGYHAFLVHKDGSKDDITAAAAFRVDQQPAQTFGAFAGATFTAAPTAVGRTFVHADYQALTGQTSLVIRLSKILIADGAPADAPAKFGGPADSNRAPSLVYPLDNTLVPPNMNQLEFHFKPGDANNDLFDLDVTGDVIHLQVFFGCTLPMNGGCIFAPGPSIWSILSSAGRGQDPLSYAVKGTSAAGGQGVGTSLPQTISFGEEDILGGLYYWNAGAGTTMRYEFGVSGGAAEMFMSAPQAGAGQCIGCHVLSRAGDKVSLGLDIPAPAQFKVFDVASKSLVFGSAAANTTGGNFFSFTPDASQIMVSDGVNLSLRDAKTGAMIQDKIDTGAMPDFSPDGKTVVYAKPKTAPPCIGAICAGTGVSEASLMLMTNGGTWGSPTVLVPSQSNNNYYPSYSPDGGWVLFNRAAIGENKDSYDQPDATLWAVPATGGAPTALLNAGSHNGDSWPKWMQRAQNYRGRQLLWFTYSSRRVYGLRTTSTPTAQLWMAAFDPAAAQQGKDPSFASFWLPFQDATSGNHIAQWVTKVARAGCTDNTQCTSSEVCTNGTCLPNVH